MSRIPIRITLDSANVPMLSFASGPTVVYVKEGMAKLRQEVRPTDAPWELTEPQLIFAENIMPIPRGLTSIGYSPKVSGIIGINTFSKAGLYRTSTNAVGYWAVTIDGKLFTSPVTGISWTEQTVGAWPDSWMFTIAKINGSTYFYISNYGAYKFNDDGTISVVTLAGITPSSIKGIAAAVGRLFVYSSTFLHFCSEVDILDFTPSLTTGAGSTQIQYIRGDIILAEGTSFGLFIYSKENIVSCQETGNTAAPYLFTEVENSAGVSDLELVASAPGLDAVYAFGAGGLQLVTVKTATPIFPEVSDFIATKVIENYNYTLHKIEKTQLTGRLLVKISYICSRYMVISYGIASLTHMQVYDLSLRRWGKLKKNHVDVFTVSEALTANQFIEYDDMIVPGSTVVIPADETKTQTSTLLSNLETFAVMDANGTIDVVNFDLNDSEVSGAVMVFGKVQLRRGRDSSLQEVQVEGLYSGDFSFVGDSVTVKGVSWLPTVQLYQENYDVDSMVGNFLGDTVGTNHAVHIEGAFDITGLTLTLVPDGVAT